ncbi:TadE/TadG family type IV pilus assembly protein [Silicimonas algicola]|nr:TadE/TadG family type IV pilus assembly protein [Silicimonas algicola]
MTIHLKSLPGRFRKDETGTTMVEFAVVIALFLLILFAILDFGRLGYNWVSTEKAMQRATRIASVRPPICANIPLHHRREEGTSAEYPAGTLCSANNGICQQVNRSCRLSEPNAASLEAQAAAVEIFDLIEPLLPQGATSANVVLRYNYDRNLGFVGGPYVPNITAELVGAQNVCGTQDPVEGDEDAPRYPLFCFEFMTPLSALASTAGAANADGIPTGDGTNAARIPFPDISVTLPAEDMNLGTRG